MSVDQQTATKTADALAAGGLLFNPATYDGGDLDPEARRLMLATIDFFETRGKAALKQAFAADLPPEVATRGKTGFGVPLDRWFRKELRPLAADLLLGGPDRGLFRRAELKRLLDEHAGGRADHGHRLWCLCMLELWQRTYVDAPRPALAAA